MRFSATDDPQVTCRRFLGAKVKVAQVLTTVRIILLLVVLALPQIRRVVSNPLKARLRRQGLRTGQLLALM